jgi:hypothetical protein
MFIPFNVHWNVGDITPVTVAVKVTDWPVHRVVVPFGVTSTDWPNVAPARRKIAAATFVEHDANELRLVSEREDSRDLIRRLDIDADPFFRNEVDLTAGASRTGGDNPE